MIHANSKRAVAATAVLLLLCGAGCPNLAELFIKNSGNGGVAEKTDRPAGIPDPNKPPNRTEYWNTVTPGIEREVLTIQTDDPKNPINVTMFRLDSKQFKGRIVSDLGNPKSIIDWAMSLPKDEGGKLKDALVINASYFNSDFTPSGFLAVDGLQVGKSVYDLDKSGMILFSPQARIIDTAVEPMTPDASIQQNAVQSYPFLISGGKPAIQKDSGQVSRRTFVGTDQSDHFYVGTVTDSLVSLYGLMNILKDSKVQWKYVLNLDGGPSTGYVANFDGASHAFDSYSKVPNVIVFERYAKHE